MSSVFRPWLAIGLAVALGVLPGLHGCSSDHFNGERDPSTRAARRISKGCDPAEESLRYDAFVGQRALAVLSWTGMSRDARDLRIPVYVVDVADGAVGVRFLQFPMREQYLHIWLGSGHITAGRGDEFLIDPCSATLEPWPHAGRAE